MAAKKESKGKMRFIRKNGRVIPVGPKEGGGSGVKRSFVGHKRKGAKYDSESGYYLTKTQRKQTRDAERYNEKQAAKFKPYRDRGLEVGAAAGAGVAAIRGRGALGILKYAGIAGVAGMIGGVVYAGRKFKKKRQSATSG